MLVPAEIPDLLGNLVDRSLVVVNPDTWRYELSESTRAYLLELEAGDSEELRKKHLQCFTQYSELMFEFVLAGNLVESRMMLDLEELNLRSAFEWALANDPKGCLHLVASNYGIWYRPHPQERMQTVVKALAATEDADDLDHAWARIELASIYLTLGREKEVEPLLDQVLGQNSVQSDPRAKVAAIMLLSWSALSMGQLERATTFGYRAIECAESIKLAAMQSTSFSF